jgi:site-specific DNA-cytosine methylase
VDLSSLNPTPAPIFPSNGEQCGQTASGFVALKKYVRKHHPKVVLLENSDRMYARVKQNDYEPPIENLVQFAKKDGYTVTHSICNAADFGLPQNRPRCYMIWVLTRECCCNTETEIMDLWNNFKCSPLPLQSVCCDSRTGFQGCSRDGEGRSGEKWRQGFDAESSKLGKVPYLAHFCIISTILKQFLDKTSK